MKLDKIIEGAEFCITDSKLIRYKKGYGFWIHKEIANHWYSCFKSCRINPFGLGFKESYGFGFKDMKPLFFTTFAEALENIDSVDTLPYWEYN